MRRMVALGLITSLIGTVLLNASPVAAEARCFPETNQCLDGRIREYWEQNGGLAVFGFPVTPQSVEQNADNGQTYQVQWLERNRLELHPENAKPYDVLLGRLGDERLKQQGIDWQTLPKADPSAAHFFAQSGHAIAHEPFWAYWHSHGLELGDRDVSERESLALFGLPISEPQMETNSSGDTVLTQWFERARFEDHGDKGVLLGLLGNETHAAPISQPPTQPTPSPSQQCDPAPTATSGTIGPVCVAGGSLITAEGQGFDGGELVSFYVTTPEQKTVDFPVWQGDAVTSNSGVYHIQGAMSRDTAPGVYVLVLKGKKSKHIASLPFTLLAPGTPIPGDIDYSQIPQSQNGRAMPVSGPRKTRFKFETTGFEPGELLGVYGTLPNGQVVGAPFKVRVDDKGNVDQRLELRSDLTDPVGIVATTFESLKTGKKAVVYVRYSQ